MSDEQTKDPWTKSDTGYLYKEAVYKDVYSAMNACNSKALINTWHSKWSPYVTEELTRNNQGGTDAFNKHPINRVVIDKLSQLAGTGCTKCEEDYDVVILRAGGLE